MNAELRVWQKSWRYVLVAVVTLVFAFPIIWIFLASIKNQIDIFADPPVWIFHPTVQNYKDLFTSDYSQFNTSMLNSLLIAFASTAFSILIGALAAYGFSRYKLKGSENILFWILSLRFLPTVAGVIPFFIIFNSLKLTNTYLSLMLVYSIFNTSFTVWLLKGFFDEIPLDLEEAAMVDGYSRPAIFFRVSLPLVVSGLAVVAIFCLIQSLNEFLLAVSLNPATATPAPVVIAKLPTFAGRLNANWGIMGAGGIVFMIPVVLFTILVRNHLIRGMSFGRLK